MKGNKSTASCFFSFLFLFALFSLFVSFLLSPRLSQHHVILQSRCLPPPSSCRRLQQRQTAAATRARERIDARARAHTPARHISRQVGIQMDTDVTPVARFSTLRSPRPSCSRSWHALRLIHSFSSSLSCQLTVPFQGCRR